MKRRHHYIPRLLLRRFASRRKGKKSWIWQTSADGSSFEISTRDAAVESHFYRDGEECIEDDLADEETLISGLLREIDCRQDLAGLEESLVALTQFLVVRTHSVRSAFTEAAERMLNVMHLASQDPRAVDAMRREMMRRVPEELDKFIATLPSPAREAVRAGLAERPEVRLAMEVQLRVHLERADVPAQFATVMGAMKQHFDADAAARSGQVRGVAKLMLEKHTAGGLQFDRWRRVTFDNPVLVLGDACAFGVAADGVAEPVLRRAKELSFLCLPISAYAALFGLRGNAQPWTDVERINQASAQVARRHVFGAVDGPAVRDLSTQIGVSSAMLTEVEANDLVGNIWSDFGGAEGGDLGAHR